MATIAVPTPNAIGCRTYSRRAPIAYPMAASLPSRAATAVSATTERLVMAILISPGTPTLRMSANSSQRGVTPRKLSLRGERPERRYQIKPKLPIPNGRINPHAAPAGPSAGSGPAPKIRRGDNQKSERCTRKRGGAKSAEEKAVERDHAREGEQVENVGRRQPQQRRQNWTFKQQLGARRTRLLRRLGGY